MAKMTNSSVEIQVGINAHYDPGTAATGVYSPVRSRSKKGGLRRSLLAYLSGRVLPEMKRMLKAQRALLPYGVAVGAVIIALLPASLFASQLRSTLSALFFAAVTIFPWYGGLVVSLLATALSVGAL